MDLLIPITVMLVLAIATAIVVARATRKLTSRMTVVVGTSLVALFAGFMFGLRGRSFWLQVLPVADAVIYADLTPILAAAVIGLAWSQIPGKAARKMVTVVPLTLITLWVTFGTLLRPTPRCTEQWVGDVCLQTSESSCSAACAATMLRHYGIAASEGELAKLCLTCNPQGRESGGTTLHGLYRGLKKKTSGTDCVVEVYRGPVEGLLKEGSGPWIISVGLTDQQAADPIYQEQYGWSPGMRHSVVLYRQASADRVDMADPSVGREQWSLDDLKVLWRGDAVRVRAARAIP